jgi:hypothetical protein
MLSEQAESDVAHAIYETRNAVEQMKDCLLRIEGRLSDVDKQAASLRQLESHVRTIRSWAHWCAAAAAIYIGITVYSWFK